MSFRVRVPRGQENQLEVVPLETALKLERHLETVAEATSPHPDPTPRNAHFRFELDGFTIEYRVDYLAETVVVTGLNRSVPADPFCGCEI